MTRTTLRATGAMGLFLIAATTFGFLATEEESGVNEALSPIYNEVGKTKEPKSVEQLCAKAFELYRSGGISVTQDQYKVAAILLKSDRLDRLHLAHDLSLAALTDGFQPSLKIVKAAQAKLLARIGLDNVELPPAGAYKPLARPSFVKPNGGIKGNAMPEMADAAMKVTVSTIQRPR